MVFGKNLRKMRFEIAPKMKKTPSFRSFKLNCGSETHFASLRLFSWAGFEE